jgi:ribosome-binding factor A
MQPENRRQKQVGEELKKAMSQIFQRKGARMYGRALVTITKVYVTKDFSIARFYLSIYNADDREAMLDNIKANSKALRKRLAEKIRHRIRRIPEVEFYLDDSLDKVFRLEKIFKQIREEEQGEDQ